MTPKIRISQLLTTILFVTSIAHSQVDSVFSFYPLNIGNSWQYNSTLVIRVMGAEVGRSAHYYTLNILSDTIFSNGKRYYIVQSSDKSSASPRYQRVDSLTAQVFAFDTSSAGEEYAIDSLRAPAHSAFGGCRMPAIPGTFVDRVDSQTYFNIRLICRHYLTPMGIGPYVRYTLTQGIGMTTFENGYFDDDQNLAASTSDTLVYAKINGKEYGTLVSVHENKEIVTNFILYQNYPNPFNSATIINYSLFEASHVTLTVCDILGRGVETLVDELQNIGFHSVTFSGNNLSSGLYFYNLRAGRFNQTRKLILLK